MSDEVYRIKKDTLIDIADAIRTQEESEDTIGVEDFAERILDLESGGGNNAYLEVTLLETTDELSLYHETKGNVVGVFVNALDISQGSLPWDMLISGTENYMYGANLNTQKRTVGLGIENIDENTVKINNQPSITGTYRPKFFKDYSYGIFLIFDEE